MSKHAAHDKWVCLACRWTAKIELVDGRAPARPSYRCPKCRAKMLFTGTAFRPPRKDDDEGWTVVGRVLATGFRFDTTSERQRVPRTLREFDAWARERTAPDIWLPEQRVRVKRPSGGLAVSCGRQAVRDRQDVLVWSGDRWTAGEVRLTGDGSVQLANAVVVLSRPRRAVALTTGARMRVRGKAQR